MKCAPTMYNKRFFKEQVPFFAVTLDKVTYNHNSYMVLMSHFMLEGRINVHLNTAYKMHSDDYSAEETAKMVLRILCETLGLSINGEPLNCFYI